MKQQLHQMLQSRQQKRSPDEVRAIAREAMIFAYAMLYNYKTMYAHTQDYLSTAYTGGFNRFRHYAHAYTPANTDIPTPNIDTSYSWAWLDVRLEPVVLRVPAVTRDRYIVFQLFDLFTYNFAYIGVRSTGYDAGNYLIAGPKWNGATPEGIGRVIRSETEIIGMLVRTSLNGASDLPNVRALQMSYIIQPLSEFAAAVPPQPAPAISFPEWDERLALSGAFIGYLNFLLQFVSPHPSEAELYCRFARIGIDPGRPFRPAETPAEVLNAIEEGAAAGLREIDEESARTTSSRELFGTREFLQNNYLRRAVAAKLGIYGNSIEEAVYGRAHADADGNLLSGANRYVWRFERHQIPPVNFFWSATMYRLPERFLIANPIDRYSIGDRTPGLVYGADGSLEICLQQDDPDDNAQRANWLPTPAGPFEVIVRLYGPKNAVLSGRWKLPPVRVMGTESPYRPYGRIVMSEPFSETRSATMPDDLLVSWNDGATKRAIMDFIARVTREGSPDYVPPDARIAVFDNDGTLWCEKPIPIEFCFILQRLAAMADQDASLRNRQPWKASFDKDFAWLNNAITMHNRGDDSDLKLLVSAILSAFAGQTVEAYEAAAHIFLHSVRHPSLGCLFRDCSYLPMIELVRYLEANAFSTFVTSGGDRDFMKTLIPDIYGIPAERVLGNSSVLRFHKGKRANSAVFRQESVIFDDGPANPVRIWSRIGRRPILAVGNANGDIPMLSFCAHPPGPSLSLLVNHDDENREFAYLAGAEKSHERSRRDGWTEVSIKNDWKTVFSNIAYKKVSV